MRVYHIVICGLPGSTLFFYGNSQKAWLSKRVIEHKKNCVDIL